MNYYKYVFVILVYRNTGDLVECLESIKSTVPSFKVIVVNAYYDDPSRDAVQGIAKKFNCDFIDIENKGYSYGNNRGIEYAQNHYDYEYIIISNPDIIVEKFDDRFLKEDFKYDIIAPKIIAASGHFQNPAIVRRFPLVEYLIYNGYKQNTKLYFFCGLLISKITREITLFLKRISRKHIYEIYCAHGSFLFLSKKLIKELCPIYDDNVFLFAEESILARKAERAGLKTCFSDYISIKHKEDGSMKLSELSIDGEMKKSNMYYYENYVIQVSQVEN